MKELIEKEAAKLDNGIEVKPYLSYAEIEAIVNQVIKFDTWSEREASIDIMVANFATNLTAEEIEKIGHEMLVKSGTMEHIRNNIRNFGKIQEAINYTQSTQRALAQILKEIPDMLEPLKEVTQKYAVSKK